MAVIIALCDMVNRKAKWPRMAYIICILGLTAVLTLRGHQAWTLNSTGKEFSKLTSIVAANPKDSFIETVGGGDAGALSFWYLESWLVDEYYGYDYCLPMINYSLSGWIPNRFFPHKYFLVDWLQSKKQLALNDPKIDQMVIGKKSTLMGSFYCSGGIIGVVLLSAAAGFLGRRLDGMLTSHSPRLVFAAGLALLSGLWMMWQSTDYWILTKAGSLLVPALAMRVFAHTKAKRFHHMDKPTGWRYKFVGRHFITSTSTSAQTHGTIRLKNNYGIKSLPDRKAINQGRKLLKIRHSKI
jgi:hypothetical protein